ncbi:hypothetical protein NQZ68_019143 [Dissostichus eleginoides]|nr:hypothetical protein NQZ68_019143 [Dissostichus eleginoides]
METVQTSTLLKSPRQSTEISKKHGCCYVADPGSDLPVVWDPLFSDTCRIDTKFLSLNYLGSYVEPQTSKGCVLSGPDKDQEVHIIELQAPNSSSAFQVDVIVDLRPLEDDAPLHRNVILLLKCAKSVNWVIKAHSVIGNLDVVASDTVGVSFNTQKLMQVSKSPKENLPSGSQALIKWAGDHGYGPVTSYTSTPVANHFTIRLRERDVVDPLESMLPPELSILRDSSPHVRSGTASRRSSLPFHFPPPQSDGLPPSIDERPWENGEPEDHHEFLNVGLSVQCEATRMVVSIEKESLQANGFAHANLTLQDPACKATVNATHYTLETPLTGCLTTVYPMQGSPMALHINSVLINHAETKDGSGGPLDYEDLEAGDMLFPRDPVELDRRFTEPTEHQSVIGFNCTYRKNQESSATLPRIVPGPGRHPVSNMTFKMELYNKLPIHNPSRQAFYTVSQKQQVFVEVTSAATDPELGFTIVTCVISPNSDPTVPSDYTLIETVCPTDDSVTYYPQRGFPVPHTQAEKQSFSFTFNSQFNLSLLFLHCDMSLCSKSSQRNQRMPPCLQPSDTCDSPSVENILSMIMHSKTSTKPLVVVDGSGPSEEPVPPSETPPYPDNDNALYVLDTATVVGIAFAAFVIGALLTGALWFIYSHTARALLFPAFECFGSCGVVNEYSQYNGWDELETPVVGFSGPHRKGHTICPLDAKSFPIVPSLPTPADPREEVRSQQLSGVHRCTELPCSHWLCCLTGETAGRQQVQKPLPASENSSPGHSVGSTQSTPCSSSSTA